MQHCKPCSAPTLLPWLNFALCARRHFSRTNCRISASKSEASRGQSTIVQPAPCTAARCNSRSADELHVSLQVDPTTVVCCHRVLWAAQHLRPSALAIGPPLLVHARRHLALPCCFGGMPKPGLDTGVGWPSNNRWTMCCTPEVCLLPKVSASSCPESVFCQRQNRLCGRLCFSIPTGTFHCSNTFYEAHIF